MTLDDAASSLGIGGRALQRELAAGGAALSAIADGIRRARSEALVGEGLLTLGEVAVRFGFREQASFTRAWRRWFGDPPSGLRRG